MMISQILSEFENYFLEIGKIKYNFCFEYKLKVLSRHMMSRLSDEKFTLISILNISYLLKSYLISCFHI